MPGGAFSRSKVACRCVGFMGSTADRDEAMDTTLESSWLTSVAAEAVSMPVPPVRVTTTDPLFGTLSGLADTVVASAVPENDGSVATMKAADATTSGMFRRHLAAIIELPQPRRDALPSSAAGSVGL